MALQVWLPLTKDLRNQGLASLTSSGTPVFKNNGKLGSKSLDLKTQISFNCSAMANKTIFSIAFWAKVNADSSLTGNWVDVIGFTDVSTSGTSGQLRWETCYGSTSYRGSTYNQAWNISSHDNATYATAQMSSNPIQEDKGKWHHYVFTTNGVQAIEYRDGIVYANYTGNGGHLNGSFWCGQTNVINGEIQDVRIYDHCLSPMEVKELSKGLVLHYPLADAYIEATTNLSNSKLSSSCYNAVTQKYNYGTNTDIYKESGTFEGRVCEKVHMGTNGLDAFPYVFFDYFQPPIGETRTLSFDYYPTIMDKVVFYTYNSPGSGNYTVNYKTPVSWSGSVTIPVQLNQWNHITITVTNTGSAASGYGYMQIGNVKHTSNTANYWLFGNIQVEAKDHATGYVGPNGTRSVGTVYDCSGFGNNGIVYKYDNNGDIIIDLNTPKYLSCTHIKAGNPTESNYTGLCYIYSNCALTTPNQLTISFWCKPIHNYQDFTSRQGVFCTTNGSIGINAGTDYDTTAMHHRDSLIDVCQDSGTWNTIYTPFVVGEWHYYTFIYNGKNIQWYKDGTFQSEKAFDNTGNLKSFSAIIIGFTKAGGVYRKNDCYMSDFRVYATALSADDVKSLYQNSAYIDSSGNVYGAVHTEV